MPTSTTTPGGWRLWEQFALRGAGFPAAGVLRLAPDGLGTAADAFGPRDPLSGPAWDAFRETFTAAAVETAHVLRDIAADDRFRAAVAWQNRPLLARAVDPFAARTVTAADRTSKRREREELVAHYWQRFCVKNDTIGFFGPVGWGRLAPAEPGLTIAPGERLIAETTVAYSSWAIDTLAATIAADPAIAPWIAPRRVPFVRVGAAGASMPGRREQPLTATERDVLRLCDGTRTPAALTDALPGATAQDVEDALGRLRALRFVHQRLEVPATARPEQALRDALLRIGDTAVRERALAKLESLEAARERVARAGGADDLCAAMTALEDRFTALTAADAVRRKAATTAPCRAVVYSDSRRAATARAGAAVLAALAPLDLLLTGAAWMTARLAERVMTAAREVHTRLAADGPVGLAAFWFGCMPILHGQAADEADDVLRAFQDHWQALLRPAPGDRRLTLTTADLAAGVRAAFGDPGSAWQSARHVSPDLMIAATDAAAVGRGEFTLVLGELHLAANTLGASLYLQQHPAPHELFAETTRDHPGPRLLPLVAKENKSRLSARIRQSLVRPLDYQVALVDQTADPHRPRVVMSADATVEDDGTGLVVVLPDGTRFPAVDVFSHVLTNLAMDLYRLLPPAPHTPRVTVDRLVVARETWRPPAAQAAFADEKDEARRFVRARRWREEHGMPRHVFVVSPTEPRPFYVDFDSPVYVTILAKAIRRLCRAEPGECLTVTEMLPAPGETWLTDQDGSTYTSELRLVAVAPGR